MITEKIVSPIHGDISPSDEQERGSQNGRVREINLTNQKLKIIFACRAAIVGSIGGLLLGYDLGVISGALPALTKEFGLSIYEQELVTSLMLLGSVVGACFGGIVCDSIGRKQTVYMVCLVFLVGSVIMTLAQNILTLYVGRVVIGIGVSISAIVDISYLAEISPTEYRGAVVGTNELMITVGILLAFLIDYSFMDVVNGWRFMFAFPIILVMLWGCLMFAMPESPRWLLVKEREAEAMSVFRITCGGLESEALKEFQHASASIQASKVASSVSLYQIVSNHWRLSMIVAISLMLMQQFSGHAPVLTYAPEIFKMTGLTADQGGIATIVIGIIKVLFTLLSLSIVDRVGRRALLLCGATGMMISLVVLTLSYSNTKGGITAQTETILSLVSVGGLVASYAIGFGPVTWLVVAELFPDAIRGRTLGIATVANWLANAIVVASYLSLVEAVGADSTFLIYAVICFVSIYLIFFYVPETHLKEVNQIQRDLHIRFQHWPMKVCCDMLNICFRRRDNGVTGGDYGSNSESPTVLHMGYAGPSEMFSMSSPNLISPELHKGVEMSELSFKGDEIRNADDDTGKNRNVNTNANYSYKNILGSVSTESANDLENMVNSGDSNMVYEDKYRDSNLLFINASEEKEGDEFYSNSPGSTDLEEGDGSPECHSIDVSKQLSIESLYSRRIIGNEGIPNPKQQ
jgi:SP family galactose:H+ symporter-like MFS transporter